MKAQNLFILRIKSKRELSNKILHGLFTQNFYKYPTNKIIFVIRHNVLPITIFNLEQTVYRFIFIELCIEYQNT